MGRENSANQSMPSGVKNEEQCVFLGMSLSDAMNEDYRELFTLEGPAAHPTSRWAGVNSQFVNPG